MASNINELTNSKRFMKERIFNPNKNAIISSTISPIKRNPGINSHKQLYSYSLLNSNFDNKLNNTNNSHIFPYRVVKHSILSSQSMTNISSKNKDANFLNESGDIFNKN